MFYVTTEGSWSLTGPNWLTYSQTSGVGNADILLTASERYSPTIYGEITVSNSTTSEVCHVTQTGNFNPITGRIISPSSTTIPYTYQELEITIECSGNWYLHSDSDFVLLYRTGGASPSGYAGTYVVTCVVATNHGIERTAAIQLRSANSDSYGMVLDEIELYQERSGNNYKDLEFLTIIQEYNSGGTYYINYSQYSGFTSTPPVVTSTNPHFGTYVNSANSTIVVSIPRNEETTPIEGYLYVGTSNHQDYSGRTQPGAVIAIYQEPRNFCEGIANYIFHLTVPVNDSYDLNKLYVCSINPASIYQMKIYTVDGPDEGYVDKNDYKYYFRDPYALANNEGNYFTPDLFIDYEKGTTYIVHIDVFTTPEIASRYGRLGDYENRTTWLTIINQDTLDITPNIHNLEYLDFSQVECHNHIGSCSGQPAPYARVLPTFSYCQNLRVVNVFDGITTVGPYSFLGCESLSAVTFSDDVTTISVYAFSIDNISLHDLQFHGEYPPTISGSLINVLPYSGTIHAPQTSEGDDTYRDFLNLFPVGWTLVYDAPNHGLVI